jgi:beta-galactosidase
MAVDRDRWYGAPIDATGMPRVEAGAWKTFLRRLEAARFHELERRVEVGLVIPAEYRRLSRVTHLLGGMLSPGAFEALGGTPVDACREDALGFKGPVQVLWWRMLAKVSDALTAAGVPYVYVDSDAEEERFEGLRVLVAPTYELADRARWKRLVHAAERGATVVFGPAIPELDERMKRRLFEVPRDARRVLLDTKEDASALVASLVDELDLARPFLPSPSPVETCVHEDGVGPRVLFVMNPSKRSLEATIDLPYPLALVDFLTDERLTFEKRACLPMRALECRAFLLEPLGRAVGAARRAPRARRRAS